MARKAKKVILYVEGAPAGANSKLQQSTLRESFSSLLEKAGFEGRLPRISTCGPRSEAYSGFCNHIKTKREGVPVLLVDSEDPIQSEDFSLECSVCWDHLKNRAGDGWNKPKGASDNQVALMATCMETWMIADKDAVAGYFKQGFKVKALPDTNLESRNRKGILDSLETATKGCTNQYGKGDDGLILLGEVNPMILSDKLPHFRRFIEVLNHHLR